MLSNIPTGYSGGKGMSGWSSRDVVAGVGVRFAMEVGCKIGEAWRVRKEKEQRIRDWFEEVVSKG